MATKRKTDNLVDDLKNHTDSLHRHIERLEDRCGELHEEKCEELAQKSREITSLREALQDIEMGLAGCWDEIPTHLQSLLQDAGIEAPGHLITEIKEENDIRATKALMDVAGWGIRRARQAVRHGRKGHPVPIWDLTEKDLEALEDTFTIEEPTNYTEDS